MKRALALSTILGLILLGSPLHGQTESVPLAKLIEQLEDRSFTVRERAERQLEQIGQPALVSLQQSLSRADAETKRRLEKVIERIERKLLLEPTMVTLPNETATLEDALAQLGKQVGYKLESPDSLTLKLQPAIARGRFWKVISDLCNRDGLRPEWLPRNDALSFRSNQRMSIMQDYHGPFLVQIESMEINRRLDLTRPTPIKSFERSGEATFVVRMRFLAEPKVPILDIGSIRLTEAETDRGESLRVPHDREDHLDFDPDQRPSLTKHRQIQLRPPSGDAQKLHLKGSLPVLLRSKREIDLSLDLPEPPGRREVANDGHSLIFEEIKIVKNSWVVSLKVERRKTAEDESWTDSINFRVVLLDDQGNRFPTPVQQQVSTRSETLFHGDLRFPIPQDSTLGPPKQLILERWRTLDYSIPFEFKDIPIP